MQYDTVSNDGGETFFDVEDGVIFGMYFFINDSRIEHTRIVYNILQVLSEIGGIFSSLLLGFGTVGRMFNYYVYVLRLLQLLYFIRDDCLQPYDCAGHENKKIIEVSLGAQQKVKCDS